MITMERHAMFKTPTSLAVISLVFFASEVAADQDGKHDWKAQEVSIVSLIAAPGQFEGAKVAVVGALSFEFEGEAVCLSKEDLKSGATKNCLAVKLNYEAAGLERKDAEKLHGRYVYIEGKFNGRWEGRYREYSGALEEIWRLEAFGSDSVHQAVPSEPDNSSSGPADGGKEPSLSPEAELGVS